VTGFICSISESEADESGMAMAMANVDELIRCHPIVARRRKPFKMDDL
jgi:hypothetical protein